MRMHVLTDPNKVGKPPADGTVYGTDKMTPLLMAMHKHAVECVHLLLDSTNL